MARHRNVRALRYSDEYDYDEVYGRSVEEDAAFSPAQAEWLYDRERRDQPTYCGPSLDEAPEQQQQRLDLAVAELRDVLGDEHPQARLEGALLDNDYDVQRALDQLLDADNPTKPKCPQSFTRNIIESKASAPIPVKIITPSADPKLPHLIKSFKLDDRNLSPIRAPAFRSHSPSPDRKSVCKTPEPQVSEEKIRPKENKVDPSTLYMAERGNAKEHLHVVVIGHVDAGKSTLMGRLLCDLGEVSQRVLHKYEQESKKIGKQSFMYAWVLDETGEERLRGITMDVGRVHFSTKSKNITVLDAPGHADFIPNMIAGAGQADVALLVVDATRGEFESGFDLGGQTREHALLVRSLGISQLAVAINKLDTTNWSEERFNEICTKLKAFLKQAGFKDSDVTYVPLSGLTGENLASPSKEAGLAEWYKGPCLIDVIDNFKSPERPVTKPFRMSVNDIFKGTGSGFCIFGKIETGIVNVGDKVLVCPTKESATVKAITIKDVPQNVAFAGDQVNVTLLGYDMQNISVGYIVCDPVKPIPVVTIIEARIVVFNIKVPITKGYSVLLHHQSLIESANILKLKASINKSTGEIIKKKPRCLNKNSVALIEIEVCRPICIEQYKDIKELGRVMLRVSGVTIAAGLITAIIK